MSNQAGIDITELQETGRRMSLPGTLDARTASPRIEFHLASTMLRLGLS